MSAALLSPPNSPPVESLPTLRLRGISATPGAARQVTYERIIDAVRALVAKGEFPTAELVQPSVPNLKVITVRRYLVDMTRRGWLKMPVTREQAAPPCCLCGTNGGRSYKKTARALRRTVALPNGRSGLACYECWSGLREFQLITETRDCPELIDQEAMDAIRKDGPGIWTPYDSVRSSWLDGLAEERSVWAEQAQRRLTGAGEQPVETPREGAEKARAVYWRVWRRLGMAV